MLAWNFMLTPVDFLAGAQWAFRGASVSWPPKRFKDAMCRESPHRACQSDPEPGASAENALFLDFGQLGCLRCPGRHSLRPAHCVQGAPGHVEALLGALGHDGL
jgi:hypothetical protein